MIIEVSEEVSAEKVKENPKEPLKDDSDALKKVDEAVEQKPYNLALKEPDVI